MSAGALDAGEDYQIERAQCCTQQPYESEMRRERIVQDSKQVCCQLFYCLAKGFADLEMILLQMTSLYEASSARDLSYVFVVMSQVS